LDTAAQSSRRCDGLSTCRSRLCWDQRERRGNCRRTSGRGGRREVISDARSGRCSAQMEAEGLNKMMMEVREMADAKWFSSGQERLWEMLALIHTEISEATDAYKKGAELDKVGEELIDAIIRILHLLSALGVDAEELYQKKMEKNWGRPYRYNTVRGG
jgi:NTP pyrophosphatase (non-canonical NTP hydrolase)